MADDQPITGLDLTDKLTLLGIIPSGLSVTRIVIDIRVDDAVKIDYETIVSDKKVTDMILDEVVKSSDKLHANHVATVMKGGNNAKST